MSDNIIEIVNNDYTLAIEDTSYILDINSLIPVADYQVLQNKPQINSVALSGNKTSTDLGLASVTDLVPKENLSNKVTVINSTSTDNQYPSAKCVYDELELKSNNSLNNLSSNANDKLLSIKSYSNNVDVKSDNQAYNDILSYYHSTFDRNKFTVQGTPIISNDGIVAGFSANNKISVDLGAVLNKNKFELRFKFKTPDIMTQQMDLLFCQNFGFGLSISDSNCICLYASSNGTSWDISDGESTNNVLSANTDYYLKIFFDGSDYKLDLSTDGINYTNWKIISNSSALQSDNANAYIGANNDSTQNFFTGSFDLKYFTITVSGEPVFLGNKTGIDIVSDKLSNLKNTVTIDNCGIATVTSNPFTIYLPETITDEDEWEIYLNTVYIENSGSLWAFYGSSNASEVFAYRTYSDNVLAGAFKNTDNTECQIQPVVGTNYRNRNIYLKFKKINTETGYKIENYLSSDNITYTKIPNGSGLTGVSTKEMKAFTRLLFFASLGYGNLGSAKIDLKTIKVIKNNKVILEYPYLQIPYTQSKTGSKIVNSYYQDRIQYMYSKFGLANYYLLDEANKNYILPMGENLDGHVTKIDWYNSALSSWEYDTNLDCIEIGSCTSGTAVTLPKAFASTNYSLSVPYSNKTKTGFTPTQTGCYIAKGKVVLD